MKPALVLTLAFSVACQGASSQQDDPLDMGTCPTNAPLFGQPNAKTGLSSSQCQPSCACSGETFTPPTYTADDLAALRAWVSTTPAELLNADPYDANPRPEPKPNEVCGVKTDEDGVHYALVTYESAPDAASDGAAITHSGACGQCSSLADLAVYIEQPDLAGPVRQCGLDNLFDDDGLRACIEGLGFSKPCAQIWAFNVRNSQSECASTCFALIDAPYHNPDGSLNDCIQCDEDKSGPVFKAVAGRTRRNSGLPNALCRPCSEVLPIVHRYGVQSAN